MKFISNGLKYISIHLHKCAETSFEKAFGGEMRWNNMFLGSTAYGEKLQAIHSSKFGLDKHSSVQDIKEATGDVILGSYYTFSFVRHLLHSLIFLYDYLRTYYLSKARGLAMQGLLFLMERNLIPPSLFKMPSLG